MKELNAFVSYEFLETKVINGEEVALYMVQLSNEDKKAYYMKESEVFPEDMMKPFDMEELFGELMGFYMIQKFYQHDYDTFIEHNEMTCSCKVQDSIWEKSEVVTEKLEYLFGANLKYFIQSFVNPDYMFAIPENYIFCTPKYKMKQFLLSELIRKYGSVAK